MTVNPVFSKIVVLTAAGAIGLIRAAHSRSRHAGRIAARRGGPIEAVALTAALAGFIVPILWVSTSWFAFANYPLHRVPFAVGSVALIGALWLFHRTHRDLGRNWSARLQILESHQLITAGVYRHVRHPMYVSLLLFGLGQTAVVPNWIAGPACLVGALVLVALRLGPEERMMQARFGAEYEAYAARTARLIPHLW